MKTNVVTSSIVKYLRKREWSMGNGQCPECCGNKPGIGWWTDTVGHTKNCPLAKSLKEVGERVYFRKLNPERVINYVLDEQSRFYKAIRWCDLNKEKVNARL